MQDNIAAFGGDPSRVTIAGQSAGGGAVLTLLGMPRAQPLFSRVISLSGPPTNVTMDASEALGRKLAELGGVGQRRILHRHGGSRLAGLGRLRACSAGL